MSVDPRTISIVGCGWLGLPLGAALARAGWHVLGSTTREDKFEALREVGIEPFLLRLTPDGRLEGDPAVLRAPVLFLNIPPGRRDPEVERRYPRQVRRLVAALPDPPPWIVFASSTSVYPDLDEAGTVTEVDAAAVRGSGRALLEVEALLRAAPGPAPTILRYGGLYGYDRRPGRFLSGRSAVENGDAPVNLVHRDDALGVAQSVLEDSRRGLTLNVVAPVHPRRQDFYAAAARRLGLDPPTFVPGRVGKRVDGGALAAALGYTFLHPDPSQPAP